MDEHFFEQVVAAFTPEATDAITTAAAHDGMTIHDWLTVAFDIYLTDFAERHPGVIGTRTRWQ